MAEAELKKIVGADNIFESGDSLEGYAADLSFTPRMMPRCVVRPANGAEVIAVVRWANQTCTPLVPVSSGAPHNRGDTVPGVGGAVIVDLSRMKRVIRVDSVNKIAMVEPGVKFPELLTELKKSGLTCYTPLAPRSAKSVIGSMLEREPITAPNHHWDSTDPLLCLGVIFGTGDAFRTGEASGPDTVEEQWEMGRVQMNPMGSSHMDVQRLVVGAQGSIGIVTWATLKCRALSERRSAWLVPAENIEPLIELSYRMLRFRLGLQLFILNGLNLASLVGGTPKKIEETRKIAPAWVLVVGFEGFGELPDERLNYQEADFLDMAWQYKLKPVSEIPSIRNGDLVGVLSGCTDSQYWKSRYKGAYQEVFFQTTMDKTPAFIEIVTNLVRKYKFSYDNVGVYIQPVVQGTSCHCEFDLNYNAEYFSEKSSVKKLVTEGVGKLSAHGALFSRPYPAWKEIAYRNHLGTAVMQRKIKQIFDPNGIMNPGKLCF